MPIVAKDGFKPSDPFGIYRSKTNPLDPSTRVAPIEPDPEKIAAKRTVKQGRQQNQQIATQHQQLEGEEPGRYQVMETPEYETWRQDWEAKQPWLIEDLLRMSGGGMAKGTGMAVEGLGTAVATLGDATTTRAINNVFGTDYRTGNVLETPGEWITALGEKTQEGVSYATREAIADSTPDGDILEPSTWTFGEKPSLVGYTALALDVFGQMTPVVAAAVATGPIGAAAVGGAQGGAAAEQQAQDTIDAMASEPGVIERESAYYREQIAAGKSPEEALAATRDAAGKAAFLFTAPISGAGGYLTGKLVDPGSAILAGQNIVARILGRAALSSVEEGAQEAAETTAANIGTNVAAGTDVDLTEGTFADFVLGALAGGVAGAGAGAMSRREGAAAETLDAETSAMDGLGPAPTPGPANDTASPAAGQVPVAPPASQPEPRGGPLTRAIDHGQTQAPQPAGTSFVVNEPPLPGMGAGKRHGLTVQLAPDQSGVDPSMRRVVLPDGTEDVLASRLLQPADGGRAQDPQDTLTPLTVSNVSEGLPSAGQRVIVNLPDSEPFAAQIEQFVTAEGGQPEALIITDDGEVLQVPADMLSSRRLSDDDIAQMDEAEAPPQPADAPPDSPTMRQVGEINKVNINFPDETLARLYDLGEERQTIKRLEGGGSSLAMREHAPDVVRDLADALGVPADRVNEIADDYRYRTQRSARNAKSGLVQNMHGLNAERLRGWRAERSRAEGVEPENTWWDDLPLGSRKALLSMAGIKRSEKTPWDRLGAGLRTRLEAARAEQQGMLDTETPAPAADDADPETRAKAAADAYYDGFGTAAEVYREALGRASERSFPDEAEWAAEQVVARWRERNGISDRTVVPLRPRDAGIDDAAGEAATSPTNALPEPSEAQKEAGNYKVGRHRLGGLDLSIENPVGSERRGTDAGGNPWSVEMKSHYGYIRGTRGRDKDHIDTFIRPGTDALPDDAPVHVVDQVDENGRFDEHKVMMGFADTEAARTGYLENYSDGWQGLGTITETTFGDFKRWLEAGKTTTPFGGKEVGTPEVQSVPDVPTTPDDAAPDSEATPSGAEPTPERTEPRAERNKAQSERTGEDSTPDDAEMAGEVEPTSTADVETADTDARRERARQALQDAETSSSRASDRIEDFGEELIGARKHLAQRYAEQLGTEIDVEAAPLSEAFPRPDYARLSADGVSGDALALVAVMRAMIPNKPRQRFRVKRWAETVSRYRELANDLLSGAVDATDMMTRLQGDQSPDLRSISLTAQAIGGLAAEQLPDAAKWRLRDGSFSMFMRERYSPSKTLYFIEDDNGRMVPGQPGLDPEAAFDADPQKAVEKARALISRRLEEKAAIDKGRSERTRTKQTNIHVYADRRDGTVFIGFKARSSVVRLKSGFDSGKAARGYIEENQDALQEKIDELRRGPQMRNKENRERAGRDWREGDVSPEAFAAAFGFRGVQFGNYVEGKRRQQDLNRAYDALMDLADGLGLPPRALSLDGSLGLAFGARGRGGRDAAAAHFEPSQVVINLTKNAGPGSLAHEWLHALDNYFARQDGSNGFMTVRRRTDGPVRPEVYAAWRELTATVLTGGFVQRAMEADKVRAKDYWSQTEELAARAFERYIVDRLDDGGIVNDYLANINLKGGLYPTSQEMQDGIRAAYDKLFHSIEHETSESGGVRLYSRRQSDTPRGVGDLRRELLESTLGSTVRGLERAGRVRLATAEEVDAEEGVQGWTDPDGTITLIADSIEPGQATSVLLHEGFHSGAYPLLGTDAWGGLMMRLAGLYRQFENSGGKGRAFFDAARERVARAQDQGDKLTEVLAVEEFGAYAIEEYASAPGAVKRWVDDVLGAVKAWALRRFGRQLGAVTPAQLSAIATAALRSAVAGPNAMATQQSRRRSLAGVADAAKVQITPARIREEIGGKLTDLKPSMLAAIPLNYFTELKRPGMYAVDQYLKLKRQMDAYRADKHGDMDAVAQDWRRYASLGFGPGAKEVRTRAAKLADLMHRATLAGVDPARTDEETKAKYGYAELRRDFEALPRSGRDLYLKVQDAYWRQQQELDAILLDNVRKTQEIAFRRAEDKYREELKRIKDEGLDGDERKKAEHDVQQAYSIEMRRATMNQRARMTKMRLAFEKNRVPEPYFPLARFGRYHVTVRDLDGSVMSFSRRESAAEMRRLEQDMRKAYPNAKVEAGLMAEGGNLRDAMDPKIVAEIESILGDAGVAPDVMDQIWQRYLQSMPDLSTRKRFIHRKGVAGFDGDALRTFANHMFHAAHQMARLKYGQELQELTNEATRQARAADDTVRGMVLANELKNRHNWVMNPTGSRGVQAVTSMMFTWYLAATPAAAMVNLSQTPMLAMPILGARLGGVSKAAVALTKASADVIRGRGTATRAKLAADERRAMDAFYQSGLIDRTQAHDLAGVGEVGIRYSPMRQKIMEVISWLYHNAEVWNRETTALAAYRMAREQGQHETAAIDTAHELTWKSHFDYSNSSRPTVMQGDTAKLLFVFQSHQVNMWYRLFRDAHQAVKGESPQARREARYQLAGIMGMMTLFSGMTGFFGYNVLVTLAGLAFDDDDDPRTFRAEIDGHVLDLFGPDLGGMILKGVPGHLTGLDLTSRIGMPDFFVRGPDGGQEGRDWFQELIIGAMGVVPSTLINGFDGVGLIMEGKTARGLEAMAPKVFKDGLQAYRYWNEGVTTRNGDPVLERDAISPWDILAEMMGFTPAKVSETYERMGTLKDAEQNVLAERRELINRFAMSVVNQDPDARDSATAAIRRWNRRPYARPVPITGDSLRQSLRTRATNSRKRQDGVYIANEDLGRYLRDRMPEWMY